MRVPRELLRPVADQAMSVVKAGLRSQPRIPAPTGVAKLTKFRQLPAGAIDAVVATLEQDHELRLRVSDQCREPDVGRVGWLWLTRPDGWDDELREVLGDLAEGGDAPNGQDRDDDNLAHADLSPAKLRHKLAGAERAAARSAEQLDHATSELERLRQSLDELRIERDSLAALIDDAKANQADAAAQRARAVEERQQFERLLARRDAERGDLQREIDDLTKRLASSHAAASKASADHAAAQSANRRLASTVDVVDVIAMIDRLEPALSEAVIVLGAMRTSAGLPPSQGFASPAAPRTPVGPKSRRQALAMPRGLMDDSTEAAAWLLSMSPVMLVDGYNVSMTAWPDAEIAEQRRRLEQLLGDLGKRHLRLDIEIVYDGTSSDRSPTSLGARAGLNVRFTDADTEADDVILGMISSYPHDRAIVVVSADKRVRDGARTRGVNVVSSHQLLGVARG